MAWRSLPLLAALLALAVLPGTARAAVPATEAGNPRVHVELISERAGVEPGGAFWVGIRQRIAPGWHPYWINPGDSGEAMTVAWDLPRGITAGPLVWPHPARIPVGPAMSFGYSDEGVVLTRLTAAADLPPGTRLALRGRAERVGEIWFFPARWGVIDHAAPQDTTVDGSGIVLRLTRCALVDAVGGAIDGVLVIRERLDGGMVSQAFAIQARPSGSLAGAPVVSRSDVQGANNYVRAALQSVAAGQPVKTPVTRAYGCTVKYS